MAVRGDDRQPHGGAGRAPLAKLKRTAATASRLKKPLRRLLHATMGSRCGLSVLLNPFLPFSTAKVLALKATVLLLITLLIKARIQIAAGSAIGIVLLLLQTLVFLAISGGLVLAAGGAALYATQQRRSAAA